MGSQIVTSTSKRPAITYKTFSHITEAEEGEKWITRVRISRKWNELDFMGTNEVTSLDVFMLDDNGDELHGVAPKKLIWKFDPLLRVGGVYSLNKFTILDEKKIFRPACNDHRLFFNWDTEVKYLYGTPSKIPQHKLLFHHLGSLNRAHQTLTLRLSRNLNTHGIKETPVVVVSSAYVRIYQGGVLFDINKSTKVFFNLGIPEVLEMKERYHSRQITLTSRNKQPLIDLTVTDNVKTICEQLECKWDSAHQALNRIIVKARATRVYQRVVLSWVQQVHDKSCWRSR
ncbi:hypothetical protein MKX01_035097 [Papaver californicum]|nr:hypothetical protein MKX01_035097 [Papaver californicum]